MSDLDADQLIYGLAHDAETVACIPRHLMTTSHIEALERAQDEIARALQKARERRAA